MNYKIQIRARSEREAQIQKSLESPIGAEDFYGFRNTKVTLKVIRADIDLPVYRMENLRTFTDQREYIAKEELELNYFYQGQEVESSQQIQHDFLVNFARKGVSDSVVPIADVLKKEKQREPILITASGVIVNGNRRVAAMRELYTEDPSLYSGFSYVDCMVLPADATADELVVVEARLQGRPETKLPYDWIGDGQLISSLISMGCTVAEISDDLNRSQQEIKNSLQALVEADIYLKDWANAEGEYSRIRGDAGQLFKDMPKRLKGKSQALQDASRVIAWSLLENRDKIQGRIYNFNAAFGPLASDVMARMSDELKISDSLSGTDIENDDFDVDLGDDDDVNQSYDGLIAALRDEDTKESAVDALIDACQVAIESEKGQKSGEASLKALVQVHSKLAAIDLSRAGKETYSGIEKQLKAILKISEALSGKISKLKGD